MKIKNIVQRGEQYEVTFEANNRTVTGLAPAFGTQSEILEQAWIDAKPKTEAPLPTTINPATVIGDYTPPPPRATSIEIITDEKGYTAIVRDQYRDKMSDAKPVITETTDKVVTEYGGLRAELKKSSINDDTEKP